MADHFSFKMIKEMKMIKAIVATVLICILCIGAAAQTTVLKNNSSVNGNSASTGHIELESNTNAGNYPDKRISIEATLEKMETKGMVLKFKSNVAIEKVEIIGEKGGKASKSTTSYNANTMMGIFVLDAPLYVDFTRYTFTFFNKDLTKAIWSTTLNRVRPMLNKMPKAIP